MGLKTTIMATETDQLEQYSTALGHYKKQRWQQNVEVFTALCERAPEELLYEFYLERVTELQDQPPDPGWDGVFTHKQK